jgi:hypothetical protein
VDWWVEQEVVGGHGEGAARGVEARSMRVRGRGRFVRRD